jgi:hypothetical protein
MDQEVSKLDFAEDIYCHYSCSGPYDDRAQHKESLYSMMSKFPTVVGLSSR